MSLFRVPIFGKTRAVEIAIGEFLDALSEAGILFGQTVREYVEHGVNEDCMRHQRRVRELERQGDDLKRSIETVLLTQMLIPDSRSDVMKLISLLDALLDRIKRELLTMTIEQPPITPDLKDDLFRMVDAICNALESTVLASRAFFTNPRVVRDHVHKIGLYESESDAMSIRMKQQIFDSTRELACKTFLRDFIDRLDKVADRAEDLGDQLSIFSLRRTL